MSAEISSLREDMGGRNRKTQRKFRGESLVGPAAYAVGSKELPHCSHPPRDYLLLYWGAFRAFFSPAFLRSLIRASRVSRPAFLSAARLASASTALRARAIPSRSAPA